MVILNEKRNAHHDSLYGLYHLSIPRVLGKRNGGRKVSVTKSATFVFGRQGRKSSKNAAPAGVNSERSMSPLCDSR